MPTPVSRFKIGLFVVIGLVALVALGIALGIHLFRTDTVEYRTYFDESVQGLDVGAPVKFRGVTIGVVSAIDIAPDRRHIEVVEDLEIAELRRLGFVEHEEDASRMTSPMELRAQIASIGITGVKYLALDFFDPRVMPPPELPFHPPANYLPAAPSTLKSLESAAMKAIEKLPMITDAVVAAMSRLERMMARLEEDDVTRKAASALAHAERVLDSLDHVVRGLDRAGIPERSARMLDDLHGAVGRMNAMFDRIDGDAGLLARATHAAGAIEDLGRGTKRTTRELESTMRGIREAAEAVTELAEAIERDPDMLLKGRAKAKAR